MSGSRLRHANFGNLQAILFCPIFSNFLRQDFFSRVHISCKASLLFWLLVLLLLRSSKRTSEKVQAETGTVGKVEEVRQFARCWGTQPRFPRSNHCLSLYKYYGMGCLQHVDFLFNSTPPVPPAIAEAATPCCKDRHFRKNCIVARSPWDISRMHRSRESAPSNTVFLRLQWKHVATEHICGTKTTHS